MSIECPHPTIRELAGGTCVLCDPSAALNVSENGGKTWRTCCEYSALRAEELEASARLGHAIRERLNPNEWAALLIDLATRASKSKPREALQAIRMLLERLPVRDDLRARLVAELREVRP